MRHDGALTLRRAQGPLTLTGEPTDAEFAAGLLAYLRATLVKPALEYAKGPVRVTGGFDTLIYGFRLASAPDEFAQPLILRVFRKDDPWVTLSSAERVRFETAVQNTMADFGYPAPRVLHSCDSHQHLGNAFLIMERIPGRIMLELFFRPSPLFFRLPGVLAETHARLHALVPQPLLRAVEEAGVPARVLAVEDRQEKVQALIEAAKLDGLEPGLRWLRGNRPPEPEHPVICHGDFHPLNILMEKGAVTGVIDWPGVRIADPAYDVGASIAIFTQGPVDLPGFLHPVVNGFRRGIVRRYLSAYQRLHPLDLAAVRYFEAMRCLVFLLEAGQQRQADLGVIARPEKPTAFGSQRVVDGIIRRVDEITGLTLTLPPPRSKFFPLT